MFVLMSTENELFSRIGNICRCREAERERGFSTSIIFSLKTINNHSKDDEKGPDRRDEFSDFSSNLKIRRDKTLTNWTFLDQWKTGPTQAGVFTW